MSHLHDARGGIQERCYALVVDVFMFMRSCGLYSLTLYAYTAYGEGCCVYILYYTSHIRCRHYAVYGIFMHHTPDAEYIYIYRIRIPETRYIHRVPYLDIYILVFVLVFEACKVAIQ